METKKKCSHCEAVEGYKRPVGRYIVVLHKFEFMGDTLELCITCYKHYQRKLNRHADKAEEVEKHSFYSNFKKFYRQALHLEHND